MGWYWHAHHGGPGVWLWLSWMVLFWGALIGTAVYFIRRRPTQATHATHVTGGPSAEDLLDERFARGEIDEDEYRKRKVVLNEGRERRERGQRS
jgi:putative membrane protein